MISLLLAFLSWPSQVAAWSTAGGARLFTVGTPTPWLSIVSTNEQQFWKFPFTTSGNVTVDFTHVTRKNASSSSDWIVKLLDENERECFSMASSLSDGGFTCSADLASLVTGGTYGPFYYVSILGSSDAGGWDYQVLVSLVPNPARNIILNGRSYATLKDACGAATYSYNQILPGCFTYFENVKHDTEADVVIEGGKGDGSCSTTIRGSLKVLKGKMTVSRVVVGPPSGSATTSCSKVSCVEKPGSI